MNFKCKICEDEFDLDVTSSQLFQWKQGALIQRVFSYLNADERELIMTGMCGKCYDELFYDDGDEK